MGRSKEISKRKDAQAKEINDAIDKAKADLKRHFAVLEAQHAFVTAQMLKEAYLGNKASRIQKKKTEQATFDFSNTADDLIKEYSEIEKAEKKISKIKNEAARTARLEEEKRLRNELLKNVDYTIRKGNDLFDDKQRVKSLLNSVDEQLLSFLQNVLKENRSGATLISTLKMKEITSTAKAEYKRLLNAHLIVIDDIMLFPVEKKEAILLFNFINQVYEKTSFIVTTNKKPAEWAMMLDDEVLATALLDRLLYQCEVINLIGKSYRLENRKTIFEEQNN